MMKPVLLLLAAIWCISTEGSAQTGHTSLCRLLLLCSQLAVAVRLYQLDPLTCLSSGREVKYLSCIPLIYKVQHFNILLAKIGLLDA